MRWISSWKRPPPPPFVCTPTSRKNSDQGARPSAETLTDPELRTPALEIIRSLIERVTVAVDKDGDVSLELFGAIATMPENAQPGMLNDIDHCPIKVIAGAGFEPATFRL